MSFTNPLNQVTVIGKVPNTDKILYNFYPSKTGDDKKDCMMGNIDVYRGYKDAEGNPVMDLITFKAFGPTARFMNQFIKRGAKIVMTGAIQTEKRDVNGTNVYTNYINVSGVNSLVVSDDGGASGGTSTNKSKTSAAPAANPFAKKAGNANPFAKGRNAIG